MPTVIQNATVTHSMSSRLLYSVPLCHTHCHADCYTECHCATQHVMPTVIQDATVPHSMSCQLLYRVPLWHTACHANCYTECHCDTQHVMPTFQWRWDLNSSYRTGRRDFKFTALLNAFTTYIARKRRANNKNTEYVRRCYQWKRWLLQRIEGDHSTFRKHETIEPLNM